METINNIDDARRYLTKINFCNNIIDIKSLPSGYSNNNFLVICDKGKFVLRKSRTDIPTEDRLRNEFVTLKFLEKINVDCVPKSVFFDFENSIHIVTYVGTQNINFSDLPQTQIKQLVKILNDVCVVDVDVFKGLAKEYNIKIDSSASLKSAFKDYGIARFKQIKKQLITDDIYIKVEYYLQVISRIVASYVNENKTLFFWHGDISNNLRLDKTNNKLFIIDWEFAKVTDFLNPAYLLVHSNFTDAQNNIFINEYVRVLGLNKKKFLAELNIYSKVIMFNDVIWAMWMWSQSIDRKNDKYKEYIELTHTRMEKLEDIMKNEY